MAMAKAQGFLPQTERRPALAVEGGGDHHSIR